MGIPEVPSQVKRGPGEALRAIFAGIGKILMAAERPDQAVSPTRPAGTDGRSARNPAAGRAERRSRQPSRRPGRAAPPAEEPPSRWRSLDQTGNVRLLTPEEVADKVARMGAAEAATAAPAAAPVSPVTGAGAADVADAGPVGWPDAAVAEPADDRSAGWPAAAVADAADDGSADLPAAAVADTADTADDDSASWPAAAVAYEPGLRDAAAVNPIGWDAAADAAAADPAVAAADTADLGPVATEPADSPAADFGTPAATAAPASADAYAATPSITADDEPEPAAVATPATPLAARLTAGQLPLPGYDDLSLASIRARLRGLDVPQLRQLIDYETANAERPELLGMYSRRIDKLESGS